MIKVATIQMNSNDSLLDNIETAKKLIAEAAAAGAQLVLLPEYWCKMGLKDSDALAIAEREGSGAIQDFLAQSARQYTIFLVAGTIPLYASKSHVYNSCLVFNPEGQCILRYNKMHLFHFDNGTESYYESNTVTRGNSIEKFELCIAKETFTVAIAVCFDIRFPEFFRSLRDVDLWLVPAAFTATTGQDHWHILLRARAIENQSYLLASAQSGTHSNGRHTYGHSMLINPWGKILSEAADAVSNQVIYGTVERAALDSARQQLPALDARIL